MNYIEEQSKVVLIALMAMLKGTEYGSFEGTWSEAYLAIRKMVPNYSTWCFPDTNKGLSYVLGKIDKQLIELGIYVIKRHSSNRTVVFKLVIPTENEEQSEVINKSKEYDMNEVNRLMELDDCDYYVMPALRLKKHISGLVCSELTRYVTPKIHIGIDKGDGKVVTLCGKHHNKDNNHKDWDILDDVNEYPEITCGACLRSKHATIRDSIYSPAKAIMHALGQRLEDAATHTKKSGSSLNSPVEYDVEPESRVINEIKPVHAEPTTDAPYTRLMDNGIVLHACEAMCLMDSPDKGLIHAVASDGNHGTTTVCGRIALGMIPKEHYPIYPDITCPECARTTRERYPDTPTLSAATKRAIYELNMNNVYKEKERVDKMYKDWQEAKANFENIARNTMILKTN